MIGGSIFFSIRNVLIVLAGPSCKYRDVRNLFDIKERLL